MAYDLRFPIMRASTWYSLQGVEHFKDIQYNEQSRYGEILLQQEYEMSCFNLEQADIDVYQQLYALYEKVGLHACLAFSART